MATHGVHLAELFLVPATTVVYQPRVLAAVKERFHVPIITDIHEPYQAEAVGKVADIIQIPAFLCRQTDLLVAAAKTGRIIHIKKGQFCAPSVMVDAANKLRAAGSGGTTGGADSQHNSCTHICLLHTGNPNVLVCERGTMFGYSDLIVDTRNLVHMRDAGCPVTMDITHALQQPAGRPLEVGTRVGMLHMRCITHIAPTISAGWRGVERGAAAPHPHHCPRCSGGGGGRHFHGGA